jgi:signal transduction histidine kinase
VDSILQRRKSLHNNIKDQKQQIVRLRAQSAQAQALANLGMLSSMIAHEMNNILTPLGTYSELALANPDDAALTKKALTKAAANSVRASKILKSMLAMAHGQKQDKKDYDLRVLVEEIFGCIARDFSKDRIQVVGDIPMGMTAYCEGMCVQQVLMNLILNGREAMLQRGGKLTISAKSENGSTVIEVADTGCGIAKENLADIFKPFYTTKNETDIAKRNGAGLGLAFCKKVIDSHDGSITVESTPGEGTMFKITLPNS